MKLRLKKTILNIPLTHMADIAYLLLIFIIIFSLLNTTKMPYNTLPASKTGTDSDKKGYLLYITDAHFDFNDKVFTDLNELTSELESSDNSSGVTIIADKHIQFGKIKKIIKVLKEYQFTTIDFLVLKK